MDTEMAQSRESWSDSYALQFHKYAKTTSSSKINALLQKLKINLSSLAQDKEEDLRALFSSWLSKRLSNGSAFIRVLCFEGYTKMTEPSTLVQEVFRSLISLAKYENKKVMIPLPDLKKFSRKIMLKLIVDSAIQWLMIGLGLTELKLVIYCEKLDDDEVASHPINDQFKAIKEKWYKNFEKFREKEVTGIKYDIYLSFSEEDEAVANQVKDILKEENNQVSIYSKKQKMDPNKCWQKDIYGVMLSSSRIIALLSPCFLEDDACIEQYNMALCSTNEMQRDYLVPLYVDTIEQMPTYMTLIQYIDCRPADYEKMTEACKSVLTSLEEGSSEKSEKRCDMSGKELSAKEKDSYDIFLSYCHQNTEKAESIKSYLSSLKPEWKIFIDTASLKTGAAWQLQLYSSVESSKVVLALLSSSYINSKVCQEEYNLAFAMHRDTSYDTRLVPALIEDAGEVPVWCKSHTPLDCKNLTEEALKLIYDTVNTTIELRDAGSQELFTTDDVTAEWRIEHYKKGLPFLIIEDDEESKAVNPDKSSFTDQVESNPINSDEASSVKADESNATDTDQSKQADGQPFHIVISRHQDQKIYGNYLDALLKESIPNVEVSFTEHMKKNSSNRLDEADLIIPLISLSYMTTSSFTSDLNIAISRQRSSGKLIMFPILLEKLSPHPTYSNILWCLFSCTDSHWTPESAGSSAPELGHRESSGRAVFTGASSSSSRSNSPSSALPVPTDATSYLSSSVDKAGSACLYAAVSAVKSIASNPSSYQGSFKTLLNVEELIQSTMLLSSNTFLDIEYNPLLFEQTKAETDSKELATSEDSENDLDKEVSDEGTSQTSQGPLEEESETRNQEGNPGTTVDTVEANPETNDNESESTEQNYEINNSGVSASNMADNNNELETKDTYEIGASTSEQQTAEVPEVETAVNEDTSKQASEVAASEKSMTNTDLMNDNTPRSNETQKADIESPLSSQESTKNDRYSEQRSKSSIDLTNEQMQQQSNKRECRPKKSISTPNVKRSCFCVIS